MAFPVAAAIGAGLGALGNVFSGKANAKQAERNYRHRYQWEVGDLKAAGLNPALAYGHNAPIPQTQPIEPMGDAMSRGAQSGSSAKQASAQSELIKSQNELLKAQTADLVENAKLKNALLLSQTMQTGASAQLTLKQQEVANETLRGLQADNRWKEGTLDQRIALMQRQLDLKGIEISREQVELVLRQLAKPGAEAEAEFFSTLGAGGSNNALQLLRLILGALK